MTPPDPALRLAEALAHERAGRPAEMEQVLRALLADHPDHAEALFALARLALRFGHAEDALTLAERVIGLIPEAGAAHHLRGVILARLGRTGAAIAALRHALTLVPEAVPVALDLARLLTLGERYDEALALLEGRADGAEAGLLRGRALMALGRLEPARAVFEAISATTAAGAEAALDLAALHIEAGRPEPALALIEPRLAADPEAPRPLYLRGVALGLLGRDTEAEDTIARLRTRMLEPLRRRGLRPLEVYVQFSRRCNLRCAMCGHAAWTHTDGMMSEAVFARVLDRCAEAGIGRMTVLAAQGEPFLNPRALDLLERAVQRRLAVTVVTNGLPLTPEKIGRLAGLGLEGIQMSFAGWDAASYESVYIGARFDRAVSILKALDAGLASTGTTLTVKAVAPDNSPDFVARTRAFLHGLGLDRINTVVPNNFAGTVEAGRYWDRVGLWSYRNLDRHRRTVCRLLMRAVGVYVDGTVTACGCYDANGALTIGDLTRDSLEAIRTGPRFAAILDAFAAGDVAGVPLCGRCDDPFG